MYVHLEGTSTPWAIVQVPLPSLATRQQLFKKTLDKRKLECYTYFSKDLSGTADGMSLFTHKDLDDNVLSAWPEGGPGIPSVKELAEACMLEEVRERSQAITRCNEKHRAE